MWLFLLLELKIKNKYNKTKKEQQFESPWFQSLSSRRGQKNSLRGSFSSFTKMHLHMMLHTKGFYRQKWSAQPWKGPSNFAITDNVRQYFFPHSVEGEGEGEAGSHRVGGVDAAAARGYELQGFKGLTCLLQSSRIFKDGATVSLCLDENFLFFIKRKKNYV